MGSEGRRMRTGESMSTHICPCFHERAGKRRGGGEIKRMGNL